MKREERRLFRLEIEACEHNNPTGHHVGNNTFESLLPYGNLEIVNEKTRDNCYLHKIRTRKGFLFKTITDSKKDFYPHI
jgi:hypothetical protein